MISKTGLQNPGSRQINKLHSNFTLCFSSIAQQPCSRGWSWNFATTHCYKYNSSIKLSWPDAHRHCLSEGGYLVKVDSFDENIFLKNVIKSVSWIGAFREVITGTKTFVWSFNWQPLNFTNWGRGEPNNWRSNESCGQMFTSGKWNDIDCRNLLSFVCEKGSWLQNWNHDK